MTDAQLNYNHRLMRVILGIFLWGYLLLVGLRFYWFGLKDWPITILEPVLIIAFGHVFAHFARYESIRAETEGVRLIRPKGTGELIPYTDIDQYYVHTRTFILRRLNGKEVTILRHHYPEAAWEKFLPVFRTRHDHACRAAKAAGPGVYPTGQLPAPA